jgi:hypothetical protein
VGPSVIPASKISLTKAAETAARIMTKLNEYSLNFSEMIVRVVMTSDSLKMKYLSLVVSSHRILMNALVKSNAQGLRSVNLMFRVV